VSKSTLQRWVIRIDLGVKKKRRKRNKHLSVKVVLDKCLAANPFMTLDAGYAGLAAQKRGYNITN
jgi:hypothetical protein